MNTSRFVAGAIVGLVVGLLVAPKKGEDLRSDIAETADKWKEKLNKMVGKANTQIDDLRDLLEDKIEGLSEDVRHRIMAILDEAGEMAYNPKRHMSNGVL